MMKRVLVTGGHVTPALAVMAELKRRGWDIVYVGRPKALEGEDTPAREMIEVVRLGYRFVPITTGRLQRTLTRHTIFSLLKIPLGFLQAVFIVLANKPQVVLSFGGYVALPIVFWSWLFGVRVVTHEQTLSPGLANKISSFFAARICVGFAEVRNLFPGDKVVCTGNPLRREIFQVNKKLLPPGDKPVIYITGGNLGAHSINVVVERILEELLGKYTVIHQCGNSQKYQDFEKLKKRLEQLPVSLAKRYVLFSFVDSGFIGEVFRRADVVITRAGANIVTEVIALVKPALFIPLPWAGESEQEKNALYLVDRGAARQILQADLTSRRLLMEIDKLFRERETLTRNLKTLKKNLLLRGDKETADVLESVA